MNNLVEPLKVAAKYWNTVPVPIFRILSELGLGPVFRDLPDNISGAIEMGPNGYRVVINNNHAQVRKRFTAAHELGHFIFHRDLLGKGVGDTRAYRADGTTLPNPAILPVHERQANSFAANLLMPPHAIKVLQDRGVTTTRLLADALEVSEGAMRIRLGLPSP